VLKLGPHATAPDRDTTGVDRLFAEFEATDSDGQCDHVTETLAGEVFRFMMLDEHVLFHALARACHSNRAPSECAVDRADWRDPTHPSPKHQT
jgi:hypothetical protein